MTKRLVNRTPALLAAVVLAQLTACTSAPVAREETAVTDPIVLLYFDGCPNTDRFRQSLLAAAEQTHQRVQSVDIGSLPATDLRRGYGSPTALIGGYDLFGAPAPDSPDLSCRVYPQGLPDTAAMIAHIRENTP